MSDDITGADLSAAMSGGDTASAAPESVSTPDAAAQPGAATTAPAAAAGSTNGTTATPPVERKTGPIPFDVHTTALENARRKAAEEVSGQWRDYEFARAIPAADLRELVGAIQEAKGDPVALLNLLSEQIAADQEHGPRLRSFAAKQLAAARGRAQAEQEPQPDAEIVNEHGQVVARTYSAAQQAKREDWLIRRVLAEVGQQIAPLKQSHDKAIQSEREAQRKAQASEWSDGFGKELASYTGYAEHKEAIGRDVLAQLQRLPDNDPRGDDPAWLEAATLRAYNRIVLPTLQQAERRAVVQDINQKANAATIGHPNAATVAAPTSTMDLSWSEALKREWARVNA